MPTAQGFKSNFLSYLQQRGLALLAAPVLILGLAGAIHLLARSGGGEQKLQLKTGAFKPNSQIPREYTCDGGDASPALSWTDPPAATKSFVLIMDDPDAPMGTFVHWVVYNLPASVRELPERVPEGTDLQGGGQQGSNDFPRIGYGGPCPPPGKPHRYFFKLYALDAPLNLPARPRKKEVEAAMQGHILARAELMGRYGR